jgi:exo-beta-1,3-glucanase (GH17 family)
MNLFKVTPMKSTRHGASFSLRLARAALAIAFASVVVACGGGGTTPVTASGGEMRPLPADFSTRKAVAYSPYRTATSSAGLDAEVITEAQIKEDLDLLVKAGFGLIRVFGSSDKVARQTLQTIFKYAIDIKVQLGAYTTGDVYVTDAQRAIAEANNQAELQRAVALAREYRDIVVAVSVGNETQVDFSGVRTKPETLARYLKTVRDQVSQPVTTDDNWAPFASPNAAILATIDFVSMHTYPQLDTFFQPDLFDWKQLATAATGRAQAMANANIAEARRQYAEVRTALDRRGLNSMPVTIGETGWNVIDPRLAFRAHPVNQKLYYDGLQAWAAEGRAGSGPKAIFYFEAFDETWKQSDDGWGLFNKNRQARHVIQGLGTCGTTWVCEAPAYTATDALYFALAEPNAAVTAGKYRIYTEAPAGSGTEVAAANLRVDAFSGDSVQRPEVTSSFAPGDANRSIEITPTPKDYGWGMLWQSASGTTENLSGYAATGTLNFSIKTTYGGKIEIGLSSDTVDRAGAEAFLQISSGEYGYRNSGEWVQVSIPLSAFVAANPKLDLSLVLSRFIIADRWAITGNLARTGLPPLYLDGIYMAK